jgi:molybdopterin molybdotransferase
MLSPIEAWGRLDARLAPLPAEVRDRRAAAGRVLAGSCRATADLPATDVSAMDGYAVREPVASGDRREVVGTVAAGDPPGRALAAGTALRIMTGAPTPDGTFTVVPVELTDGGTEAVVFARDAAQPLHIRRRAEIVERGQVVLEAGARLTPGALSLLASHGIDEVSVHRAPRVGFVSTGNEVVPAHQEPGPGQLRDSHSDFLLAAARGLGLTVEALGIARDELDSLAPLIASGLELDVLLVSGGVSMGAYDVVEDVLAELGCEILFDEVAIQPGKPLVAARHPGGLVFGLPGNPASVMVCFWLYVRPALRRLMGIPDSYWRGAVTGILAGPLPGAKGRDRFLPAAVEFERGATLVHPVAPKGSHDLVAYARGNALVRVPADSPPASPGDACELLPLADWPQSLEGDR